MGIIRKTTSLTTLGLVDYRSDKERVARSARLTRKAVKQQTRQQAEYSAAQLQAQQHQIAISAQQAQLQAAQLAAQYQQQLAAGVQQSAISPAPQGPPAGWYAATDGEGEMWWDGTVWTGHRR